MVEKKPLFIAVEYPYKPLYFCNVCFAQHGLSTELTQSVIAPFVCIRYLQDLCMLRGMFASGRLYIDVVFVIYFCVNLFLRHDFIIHPVAFYVNLL